MYKIVEKKILNPTVIQLWIEAPLVANKAKPGQFIILRVDEDGERIPLTVAGVNKDNGTVKIIFKVVGGTTKKLSYKEVGEYIQDFVGPLGVATHLDGLKRSASLAEVLVALSLCRLPRHCMRWVRTLQASSASEIRTF